MGKSCRLERSRDLAASQAVVRRSRRRRTERAARGEEELMETPQEALPADDDSQSTPPAPPINGKAVGLRDVARLANVSVATVSMVLNSNPRISRPTQLRVQKVIDRMGYQPTAWRNRWQASTRACWL